MPVMSGVCALDAFEQDVRTIPVAAADTMFCRNLRLSIFHLYESDWGYNTLSYFFKISGNIIGLSALVSMSFKSLTMCNVPCLYVLK